MQSPFAFRFTIGIVSLKSVQRKISITFVNYLRLSEMIGVFVAIMAG